MAVFSFSSSREEFDQGLDVVLDDSQNVHDVAALLKEFSGHEGLVAAG